MQVYDYLLNDLIEHKKDRVFSNNFIWSLLSNLNGQLLALHSKGIIYGNINPFNILFLDGIYNHFIYLSLIGHPKLSNYNLKIEIEYEPNFIIADLRESNAAK